MGSRGHGLILAARAKPPKKYGDNGWNALRAKYRGGEKPETPRGKKKCAGEFVGFYLALGGEVEQRGVPDMDEPLSLAGGTEAWEDWPARFRKRYLAASAAWVKFSSWARENGVELPAPSLYIVETEIA